MLPLSPCIAWFDHRPNCAYTNANRVFTGVFKVIQCRGLKFQLEKPIWKLAITTGRDADLEGRKSRGAHFFWRDSFLILGRSWLGLMIFLLRDDVSIFLVIFLKERLSVCIQELLPFVENTAEAVSFFLSKSAVGTLYFTFHNWVIYNLILVRLNVK